jgi:hypothetical protein
MVLFVSFVLSFALDTVTHVDATTPESVQVALAESAAPGEVSRDAAVFVIGDRGYRQVRAGTNGFTCLVSRQRRDTLEPECFDAEGTATVLPARLFVEDRRAAGIDDASVDRELAEGYRSGRFIAPRKPGIVYMLSSNNHVFDPERQAIVHFPGHLMFYAPYATEKEVGRGPGAPYIVSPGTAHALMIVVPASMGDHK